MPIAACAAVVLAAAAVVYAGWRLGVYGAEIVEEAMVS